MDQRPRPFGLRAVLLSVVLVTASGCSAFRASVRDFRNDDMLGQAAPALDGGEWVGVREASAPRTAEVAPWRLLTFFMVL